MLRFVCAVLMLGAVRALPTTPVYETVYAENFGLNASNHTDINGVLYQSRGYRNQAASANLYFTNVVAPDQVLYSTFLRASAICLCMPVPKTGGDYRLIVKFVPSCPTTECSFNMTLNNKHRVLSNFNVYQTVEVLNKGFDHIVDFSVCDDRRLWYRGETSMLSDWVISLLVESERSVQISAIALFRRIKPVTGVCQRNAVITTSSTTTPASTMLVPSQTRFYDRYVSDRNPVHFQFDLPEWFRGLNKRSHFPS